MSEGGQCSSVTSPSSAAPETQLDDWLPADGRNLFGEVSTPKQVSVSPPIYDPDNDVSVGLLELLGFPRDFCEALEAMGGCSTSLATKLLSSHHSDGKGEFVAGQLCRTDAQRKYYTQTLDARPMVSRWMTTGYELPFSSVPSTPLSAPNNQSLHTNREFAIAEIGRQVKMGILSEVP